MLDWVTKADLSHANSFGFKVTAERYVSVTHLSELKQALHEVKAHGWPLLILGGGSNLILHEYIPGAVISIDFTGIHVLADEGEQVILEANAGENWHAFVSRLLEMGLHGLENLALIPGNVGASPVQNIGAYGVEVSDRLHSVIAYDTQSEDIVQLSNIECKFRYRNSIFKSEEKGRYIILRVRFLLDTFFKPSLEYGALQSYIANKGVTQPQAHHVFEAVCDIRSSKLPDPQALGNAGSFFENPVVPEEKYNELKGIYPSLVGYPERLGFYKLAAGWLIDQAGWKGVCEGGVGVYEKQALVLVNHGQGTVNQLIALASQIQASVKEKYGVTLHMEPRIYPIDEALSQVP